MRARPRLLVFNLVTDADDPILGFTSAWLCALAREAERVDVITMRMGRLELPANVTVASVGKERGYSEPRRAIEFYRLLARRLGAGGIDGAFSHMAPIFSVLAAPVLRRRRIPLVTWYAHPSLTWTLRLAHHLSDRMVASLPTAYPYRRDKLRVIGQGIDTDLFSPNPQVTPSAPPVILCVGRLSAVKDQVTIVRAAARLRERSSAPFRVCLVGGPGRPEDAAYVRRVEDEIRRSNLGDTVTLAGPVPMAALADWYRRATVHVNATPTGSGDKVAWEAMGCGCPTVVANEGFRETLGRYTDALLFRHGDADHLARRLESVLAWSADERGAAGAYLRGQVAGMHGLHTLPRRLMAVFDEVAARNGDGG